MTSKSSSAQRGFSDGKVIAIDDRPTLKRTPKFACATSIRRVFDLSFVRKASEENQSKRWKP